METIKKQVETIETTTAATIETETAETFEKIVSKIGFDLFNTESKNFMKVDGDTYILTTGKGGQTLIQYNIKNKICKISSSILETNDRSNPNILIYGVKAEATQLKLDFFIKTLLKNMLDNNYKLATERLPKVESCTASTTDTHATFQF